ncbi:MAG: Hpt domain-containing protein [Brevundimonas sp.]|uniref:Hpt domain-containing protein n=1 Tax=Brevundimonas sp. TaxID=1871086 RepID=UPI00391BB7FC
MTVDPLAELRDRFRKKAKEEASAIRLAWARGAEGLQDVEHLAHGLAGAAGIFGFVEVGAAAVAVDGRFAAGEVPREEEVDALVSAIDRI